MAFYRQVGEVPPKRHTQFRRPTAALYYEELMGEEGFSSDSSLLYHREHPVGDRRRPRRGSCPTRRLTPNRRSMPRHLKLHDLFPARSTTATDPVTGRRLVLGNADVRISYAVSRRRPRRSTATPSATSASTSSAATAIVETVFGALEVGQGDYVIIPRATTHRWIPTGDEPLRTYAIEANSHIGPPKRYLSKYGQFLEHAPYCERDLRGPAEPLLVEGSDVEVYVKHRGTGPGGLAGTIHVVPEHPFDVVGWDGCLYPYAFNIADFEPITGRVHQPPPVHQVFEGHNFVICNFVPRKVDYHPLADPGALLPLQRRLRRDHVLRRRRLRGPQGLRHRQGLDLRAPGRPRHGPQPGAVERVTRQRVLRRARRHGRHLPPAGPGRGRPRLPTTAKYAWSWSGRGPSAMTVTRSSTGSSTTRRCSRPGTPRWPLPFPRTGSSASALGALVGPFVVPAAPAGRAGRAPRRRPASSTSR